MAAAADEVNFDGIVGPTHHYGGLSLGNVASQVHRHQIAYPRQAALQGLEKMKLLADWGLKQAVLPPHERPHWGLLRRFFSGNERQVIERAARDRPDLLSVAYSAAAMWAANAATVSPSADTRDGRVHFTPANLFSTAHRQLEADFTTKILRTLFPDPRAFAVHAPLPADPDTADEGAANQMRIAAGHAQSGLEVFVYGRDQRNPQAPRPSRFPARQAQQASVEIAARHLLEPHRVLLVQQHPAAIDAGVFHNDVIAVANELVLLCHERAYVDQQRVLDDIQSRTGDELTVIEVAERELPLEEAVRTYLFNSQLLTLPDNTMLLLCPAECAESAAVQEVLRKVLSGNHSVRQVRYIDVRQSMQNGGGPACLRLRVVLTAEEQSRVHPGVWLTAALYDQLRSWVTRYYREELAPTDLADPHLIDEGRAALDDLSRILQLGSIYPFQRDSSAPAH